MAFTFTDENVKQIIATGQPVVIDFWATWCHPCMAMAPSIDRLADTFEGQAVIGKYNVEDETEFCAEQGIRSLPTILFYKDGKKTSIRLAGSQSYETLEKRVRELLTL